MPNIVIPFRPNPGDPEDITQIIADFDAVTAVVNGNLEDMNLKAAAAIAWSKMALARGTSLPGSPSDGEIYFYAAGNGVVWTLRYNAGSASTYKWECVGGPSLFAEVLANESTTSTTYVDLTTYGPVLTLPLAGEYEIDFGALQFNTTGQTYVAPKIGIATTIDGDAIRTADLAPGSSLMRKLVKPSTLAGQGVRLQYRTSVGTGSALNRWLAVRPVRVI